MNPSAWAVQKRSWQILKNLNPAAMDLDRIQRIRSRSPESLARPEDLEALLLELGLNNEGLNEFPAHLHPYCGAGLRIWQYPVQFSKYLAQLAAIGVRSTGDYVCFEYKDQYPGLGPCMGIGLAVRNERMTS